MYDLDTVKIVERPHFDISDIPAEIVAAYERYASTPYHDDSCMTTAAQKRTRTLRFNKFCALCDELQVNIPSVLVRLASNRPF